ncbi:RNA 3'-terminal phosphate cyclase domain-containing protein [Mycena floridula]|nr:RNA 3'-terminal phosphate cyclase domain-containing protein [Mycena floridula]
MASKIIDGSILEGGGQILRNSISLAALLNTPVEIHSIRNGRKEPGLKNQHRTGLNLATQIAAAQLTGAEKNGSTKISFFPGGKIVLPAVLEADAFTAGATTLLMQISLPLLLFSNQSMPSTLVLKGGTNAGQAPQADYIQHVFLPFARKHFGLNVELEINKRGYYPKGGGQISLSIFPTTGSLTSFNLMERGRILRIGGIAHFAGLPGRVGVSMVEGATQKLKASALVDGCPVEITSRREKNEDTVGAGSGIVLWAELEGGGFLGASAVGSRGTESIKVGQNAAEELIRALETGGVVDEWLQDQIIILMALAKGESRVRCGKGDLTLHTRTAIWVAEQLTSAKFTVEEEDLHQIIRCQGIGYSAY